MKSYTDIEQSSKLAEILPLESADMFCADVFNEKETHSYNFHILSTWGCNTFEELKDKENKFVHFIPCWSLVALLDVLPEYHLSSPNPLCNAYCCRVKDFETHANNPVDACVAMIIKLHELNLL